MFFLFSGHGNLNIRELLSGVQPKQATPSPSYSFKNLHGDFLKSAEFDRLSLQQNNYLIGENYFLKII